MFDLKNNTVVGKQEGILMPAPRTDRPNRNERFWFVRCNGCGTVRTLRKCDIIKDSYCRSCSSVMSSSKSSTIEDQVAHELKVRNIHFERHVPLLNIGYNVDFYLPKFNVYIEVIGYWHKKTKHVKDRLLKNKYVVYFVETIDEIRTLIEERFSK